MGKPTLYRMDGKGEGKTKRQIATEAFQAHGPEATKKQVDAHFKKYSLKECETSMYYTAKGEAKRSAGIQTKTKPSNIAQDAEPVKRSATAAIRDILKEKGIKTETKTVIDALNAQGISCHPKLVYDVRTELRSGRKKKRNSGDVLLGQLQEVKRIVGGKPERFKLLKEVVALAGKIGLPRLREVVSVVEDVQLS